MDPTGGLDLMGVSAKEAYRGPAAAHEGLAEEPRSVCIPRSNAREDADR